MSNLEHLIENGLCHLSEGKSYREWHELMQQDCNWNGNENITLDNLWEICQYVIFTWDAEKTFVRCKDCTFGQRVVSGTTNGKECVFCELVEGYNPPDWFCADGERR